MTEELLNLEHVARVLGVHPRTVMNFVERGEIRAIRVGKQVRFRDEDVKRYILDHPYEPKKDDK